MKLGIMQPYFWPYLGYFQLIRAVDAFVVYDDIKYTKKGWINRNRILVNGAPQIITLPLAAASDDLDIRERSVADTFAAQRGRLERRIAAAYHHAPHLAEALPVVKECLACPATKLFDFLLHSLRVVLRHLEIATPVHVSSTLGIGSGHSGQDRVLATCARMQATDYVNPPGGRELYDRESFRRANMRLQFLRPRLLPYPQFGAPFVASLSIIDVMMFNSRAELRTQLDAYELDEAPSAPASRA